MRSLLLSAALVLSACAAPPREEGAAPPAPLASEALLAAAEAAPVPPDFQQWIEPFDPFTIIGDVHFVGTAGVSAFLITTPEGHFLIDGGIPRAAPRIIENIAALGFSIADVKYLFNSHAHFDHSGALARLQRESGAIFVASEADRAALESGRFPYGPAAAVPVPPIRVDRVIADGESITLGGVTLTAYLMPGHTPGCTSYAARTTGADGVSRSVFFHCSASVGGQTIAPESYPGMVADYRRTFARGREIETDVFLANHPQFFQMQARRARQQAGDPSAFVDPAALRAFSDAMEQAFNAELARQQAAQ